ncbi:MAG: hypothetical protein R3F30_08670 [Planctomycetota bacterium]
MSSTPDQPDRPDRDPAPSGSDPEPQDPLVLPKDLELDPELSSEFAEFLATCRRLESPAPDDRLAAALRARILLRRRYFDPPEPRGLGEHFEFHRIGVLRLLRQSRLARWVLALALLSLIVWQVAPLVVGGGEEPADMAGAYRPDPDAASFATLPGPEPKPPCRPGSAPRTTSTASGPVRGAQAPGPRRPAAQPRRG